MPEPAYFFAFIDRAERVGRVLDDFYAVRVGGFKQRVHVAGVTAVVHRHYGFGARRDAAFDVFYINVKRLRHHLAENRRRADGENRLNRGGESERGHYHLVAGADVETVERYMQRGGAVGDSDGVFRAGVFL